MRINFVSFSQWLILCGIVCGKYGEVIMLILFFFLLLTFKKGQIYNCKGIIVFFFLLGSYTIPLLLFNGYSLAKFIQQYTLLFFCVFIYRQFFILNRTNLDALWNKYIRISYYVSVLGIIQFIICLFIGIDIFPNAFVPDGRVMRIHSIFQEAGNLGTFLIPAVAYIVFSRNFFLTHIRLSLIVLVVELLTFTTIAYTAFLLIFVTWCYTSFKSIRYLLMGIVVFVFYSFITSTLVLSDNGNDLFLVMKTKFIQTIPKADNFSPNDFEMLNLSSYSILSNLWVASQAPMRMTGTGLGSHELNYERVYQSDDPKYGSNKTDAYSLLIRIYSEFGYLGLFLFFVFLIKFYNPANVMSKCMIFLFISMGVRGGHYTLYGVVFFSFFYYYLHKKLQLK